MAKLEKIPPKQLGALASLSVLNDADFQMLIKAIKEAHPALSVHIFSKQVIANAKTIPQETIEAIIDVIWGLCYLVDRKRIVVSDIMSGIIESAKEGRADTFKQLTDNLKVLEDRIALLFSIEQPLGISAKAFDVLTEHDHIFLSVRILSDMRPVFTKSAESAAAGFVIHNLCIHYRQGGQHKDFYAAMDNSDLKALKDAISRAETKASILKTAFKSASIPYMDVE